jgi:signal transduction histidine kinase
LTTFLGLAEVAKITVQDKNALELFDKVRETALNLDKMLVKLQSISDVGTQQLYYEEASLKDLILNTIGAFRSDLENKSIRLILNFETERKIFTYPVLVKILIENLLENSVNFCKQQDSYVSIRTFDGGDTVGLEVSDNGQGFAPEFSEKIFDMYFRANYMSKGNGLGLYIVKKAVDKLSGTITFKSVQYEGSTFTVLLPVQPYGKYIS